MLQFEKMGAVEKREGEMNKWNFPTQIKQYFWSQNMKRIKKKESERKREREF